MDSWTCHQTWPCSHISQSDCLIIAPDLPTLPKSISNSEKVKVIIGGLWCFIHIEFKFSVSVCITLIISDASNQLWIIIFTIICHHSTWIFWCFSVGHSLFAESHITRGYSVSSPDIWISQYFSSSGNLVGLFPFVTSSSYTLYIMAEFTTSGLLRHNSQLTGSFMVFSSLSKYYLAMCPFFHTYCSFQLTWIIYYWLYF